MNAPALSGKASAPPTTALATNVPQARSFMVFPFPLGRCSCPEVHTRTDALFFAHGHAAEIVERACILWPQVRGGRARGRLARMKRRALRPCPGRDHHQGDKDMNRRLC